MANASGLTLQLELTALPPLPGALKAAATGLVPAGAGKNRDSVASVLDIADGADPLMVDLALDPQTSGGLLAALPAADARRLQRRLPSSAIVGRATAGTPGAVVLKMSL